MVLFTSNIKKIKDAVHKNGDVDGTCKRALKGVPILRIFRLPKTIMMHFVEGLPNSMTWSSLDFTQGGRMFKVTGAVQFKTHPDHFVAWLRDPVCKYHKRIEARVSSAKFAELIQMEK